MPTTIPPIREFPKDGRRWRIDWLGAIRANSKSGYERTIDVIISPVKLGISHPKSPGDVVDDERQIIRIGVGQLPFLEIGSIWKDRRIQSEFSGKQFRVDNVEISTESQSIITIKDPDSNDGWMLPAYAHKVGRAGLWEGLNAKCIAIEYRGDPLGIIIPAAEIIRFYYATSSPLAHTVINGIYQHSIRDIINPELSGFDDKEKKCSLRLRQYIADEDAWTIGRIVNSPQAWAGAKVVHDSIIGQNTRQETPYPNCRLPFQGTTSWLCHGIDYTHDGLKRLLILKLITCSAPFPYDILEVTRDNDNRKDGNSQNDDREPAWLSPHPTSEGEDERELQTGVEPNGAIQSIKIPIPQDRFGALDGKEIIKPPKEECQYVSGQFPPLLGIQTDQLGTGQGSYEAGTESTAPAEATTHCPRKTALPASLEILDEVAHILNGYEGVTAKIRVSPEGEYTLPLLSPLRVKQWSYLDSRKRTYRRVRAININHQGTQHCFVEFEQREAEKKTAGLVYHRSGGDLYEAAFSRLLFQLSKAEGTWSHHMFENSEFTVTPMKHTWSNIEGCAKAIRNRLL